MKSLIKCLAVVLVAGLLFYGFDAAAENNFFTRAFDTMSNVFKNVRVIVYVVGAFALIGLGVAFIFGKAKWQWLAYLAIGLAIVAAADLIVNYAVGSSKGNSPIDDISSKELSF